MRQWVQANGGPLAIVVVGLTLVSINRYLGGLVAIAGATWFVVTHPRFHRHPRVLEKWDYSKIEAALREAPPRSRIRVLETWLPHVETLAPRLIDKDKDFSLQVLLMNPGQPGASGDLLSSRVEHRDDFDRREASHSIAEAINILVKRRKTVQARTESTVDVKIRLYTFLPFGPFYDIGGRLFVGIYPSHTASEDGPMLMVSRPSGQSTDLHPEDSRLWSLLDRHFQAGWEGGEEVLDCDPATATPVLR
jgi:hypothetical protein